MSATANNALQMLPAATLPRSVAGGPHELHSELGPGADRAPNEAVPSAYTAAGEARQEAQAIELAHNGNHAGFEYLYRRHSRRVFSLCLRMLRNATEAEDLTQEVFLLVFRKFHTFRGESAFSTWLHRLAVNLVLMHLRRKCPGKVTIEAGVETDDDHISPSLEIGAPDLLLEGSVDRLHLERCITRLPAGCRLVFVLFDIEGYQHSEIAEIIGRSVGDSKSQLHKARKRLRVLLHELQREKARDQRIATAEMHSRVSASRKKTLGKSSDSHSRMLAITEPVS
jgi:RNA polymerase sigma-70 factor (ECF subfamily)